MRKCATVCVCIGVCVCVHIHKSKEQKQLRGGGAESLLLFRAGNPRPRGAQITHPPNSSHPLCSIPAPQTSARTEWWIRTRFCVVACLVLPCFLSSPPHLPLLSSAHSLPPPLLPYACYSFALPLSHSLVLCSASHFSSFLPLRLQVLLPHLLCLRVPLFSCHLRVISLRLSRAFDFFRNSPCSLSPFTPLSNSLSLSFSHSPLQ